MILHDFFGEHSVFARTGNFTKIVRLEADLDAWLVEYNQRGRNQDRWYFGKTPTQTFL